MKSTISKLRCATMVAVISTLISSGLLLPVGLPRTQAQGPFSHGSGFATPQEAVNALVEAAAQFDSKALGTVLGPYSYDVINTGEPARDKEMATEFATQAR